MTRFGALLLVTTLGCAGEATTAKRLVDDLPTVDAGIGGSFSLAGRGGSDQGGSSNVGSADAGTEDAGEGGRGGSNDGDAGAGPETGDAGTQVGEGGEGGSGQGGSSGAGQGGSDQGGAAQGGSVGSDQGGSNQGGTGGDEPTTCVDGYHCDGLTLTVCDGGEEFVTECGTLEVGLYCSETEGCYGECVNGDVRCSGETAEACVDGAWTVSEECAFQCVNGACEGACEPGTVVCEGTSQRTCGSDFHFESPVACPTQEFFTTTCSAGECGLEPIACGEGTADCDENGSCESNLSSVVSCGACGVVCPAVDNASSNCNGTCTFTCDDGFNDCDGEAANGCEVGTASDSLNCGACGNSCYGGACTDGVCEYDFEVVSDFSSLDHLGGVLEMAVGPTHVYWWTSDDGTHTIRRAPKNGGDFEILTTFQATSVQSFDNMLLVDNGQLYWAAPDGIYRMPEAGGTPVKLTSHVAMSLAISAGKLYWNDSNVISETSLCTDIPLRRVDVVQACNASKVTTFYSLDLSTLSTTSWQKTGDEYSPVLGVVGGKVYVTRFHFTGPDISDFSASIRSFDAATGGSAILVANGAQIEGNTYGMTSQFGQAVLSETEIVFTTFLADPSSGFFGLCRTPLNVAEPYLATEFVTSHHVPTSGAAEYLDADASYAYYIDYALLDPAVLRVSLENGDVETMFSSMHIPRVASDLTHVYWAAQSAAGEWAILRTEK